MHFGITHKLFLGCILVTLLFFVVIFRYISQHQLLSTQYILFKIFGDETHILYNLRPSRGENNIIFLETSCVVNQKNYESLQLRLTSQQACAVESAANTNPDASIYLFYTCPLNNASLSMSSQVVQRVFQHPNVHVWHESMESFFAETPLEELYRSGKMKLSKYSKSHASDVMRFLVLWKYGGAYLDLDFIVMRQLNTLEANFAGIECCNAIASGALGFSTEGIGKEMADLCVEELRTNFRGDIFNHNGPVLITRVLQALCGLNDTKLMTKEACKGFAVLPSTVFYPIIYEWRLFYNESESDSTMEQISKGHAVHLWNTHMGRQGGGLHLLRPGSRQPLALLEQKYCPIVYEEAELSYVN